MATTVKTDTTTRVVEADVQDVPDIDVTRSYHFKPRVMRPNRITLTMINGSFARVNISGGLVLKSGAASESITVDQTWYRGDVHRHPNNMPEWAKAFVKDVMGLSS